MDAAPVLSLTRRWWWLILLGAVIAVAAYGVASRLRDRNAGPQIYRAAVTMLVTSRGESETPPEGVVDRPWELDRLMSTYAEIIRSDAVAARAALELGGQQDADAIRNNISVDTPGYTQILKVTARGTTPDSAERLAGAIAWSANAVREERQVPGVLTLFDQTAAAPAPNDDTQALLAVAIVALAGAAGAAAIIITFEYATNSIREARDAESATGLQVLATIPASRTARALVNGSSDDARRAAERYRMLRTAFGIATKDAPLRSVLVSAPAAHCGATSVAVNFALAVAQTGRRVALVDANLRSPALHTALGTASEAGLTEALDRRLELDTAAMPSAPGVAFIAAGAMTDHPSELLDSPRFDALLAQLRDRFELVVFDSPAALDFADASIVASKCDAAIVVLRADYSTRDDAVRCVQLLTRAGTRVVGLALTQDTGVFRAPALAWLRATRRTRAEAAAR